MVAPATARTRSVVRVPRHGDKAQIYANVTVFGRMRHSRFDSTRSSQDGRGTAPRSISSQGIAL
jgi:hypothetical protein